MKLGIIFACDEDGGIGKDGKMPWHFPGDLQQFKDQTMGLPMIMGRKTFESFGGRMLPGRPHIVISSEYEKIEPRENLYRVSSYYTAKQQAEVLCEQLGVEFAWVIGGAQLIQQARPDAQKIRITHIHDTFDCDVKIHPSFFMPIMANRLDWKTVEEHERYHVTEYLMW